MSVRRVMVLNEPQKRPVFLDISTEARLDAVSLQILTGRFGGKHKHFKLETPVPPSPLPFTKDDYLAEKNEERQKEMLKQIFNSADQRADYEIACRMHAAILDCIARQDAALATPLLAERNREGRKGEGYSVFYVEEDYQP